MSVPTVAAGWPPSPGLDKEEPQLWHEDDIPHDDTGESPDDSAAAPGAPGQGRGDAAPDAASVDADAQRTP